MGKSGSIRVLCADSVPQRDLQRPTIFLAYAAPCIEQSPLVVVLGDVIRAANRNNRRLRDASVVRLVPIRESKSTNANRKRGVHSRADFSQCLDAGTIAGSSGDVLDGGLT